ncbi:MAG: deoxyribodipyrimidine photo-lyase [Gemmatimonadaceae bacterium]|nr:deoxyribodipyrimidine photo-lyase [Chitinophagaceae bacterium]
MKKTINICWFRRDLRLTDNAALYHALKEGKPVLPIFIFDKYILDELEDKSDRRVGFIHAAIEEMQSRLTELSTSMEVYYGFPEEVFAKLTKTYDIDTVFANHDYEHYAIDRDNTVAALLGQAGIKFKTYKDHVIFEKTEVVKDDGKSYSVFTPYSRKWKSKLNDFYLKAYPTEPLFTHFYKQKPKPICSLEEMGFAAGDGDFPSPDPDEEIIRKYGKQRDFPGINGTSKLGVHLRFGTVSIRKLARLALGLNETFLNELIWRDFYQMVLANFPQIGQGKSFRPEYDNIRWRNNEEEFRRWCEGQTGFPIVDAGMRELNATGFMHNRVRMIVASFLTKDLLVDWRWGEAYFAAKLLDFDFAANNGGWQWASGSGCDAAPYFRVFNPSRQAATFDKGLVYIRKWVPELDSFGYPSPLVDHDIVRKRCLEVYAKGLNKNVNP